MIFQDETLWAEGVVFITCTVIFFTSRLCSPLLIPAYKDLSKTKKVDWDSRVVSNANAVVTTGLALYALIFVDPQGWMDDPFLRISAPSMMCFSVLLGYFAYDLCLIMINRSLLAPTTIIHHVLGLWLFGIGRFLRMGHSLLLIYTLTECTTPLVNLRWMLAVLNLKNTSLYLNNGIGMALGFLLVRSFIIPSMCFYLLYSKYDISLLVIPTIIRYSCYSGMAIIHVVNTYWTFLIWQGLFKAFKDSKQGSSKQEGPVRSVTVKQDKQR
eukprot:TRINITY_DN2011_c0_g1_i2.p1 TRINITY_DN2011_c0_g1~~TRINITY_DN2011_c0_g1_i2.p1  ORF type:complete len:293 (-),score=57.06 TRINITY_DN2011_c0_g1_i2:37-843(-)